MSKCLPAETLAKAGENGTGKNNSVGMGGLKGKLEGFEQEYIFPAPLIDPIGKISKEWHVSNRSHKVNKYLVEKAILKIGS